MKRSWIGGGILAVLLVVSLLTGWGMSQLHGPIARELDQAAVWAQKNDWPQAQALAQSARDRWDRGRNLAACVADHTPMEEIDNLFAQLSQYAQGDERTEFAAICAELACRTRAMAQAHGLTWWSFF